MQLILFVEICPKMSSRMIFWSNKSIFTLIWIPSKYTQMSVNPNHYLEPCHRETAQSCHRENVEPLCLRAFVGLFDHAASGCSIVTSLGCSITPYLDH